MEKYEYKVLRGRPGGTYLMPWASKEVQDKVGLGSYERRLNKLADEGWEIVKFSTVTTGNFIYMIDVAVTLLRRPKDG